MSKAGKDKKDKDKKDKKADKDKKDKDKKDKKVVKVGKEDKAAKTTGRGRGRGRGNGRGRGLPAASASSAPSAQGLEDDFGPDSELEMGDESKSQPEKLFNHVVLSVQLEHWDARTLHL